MATTTTNASRKAQFLQIAAQWEELAMWREVNMRKTKQITDIIENIVPAEK